VYFVYDSHTTNNNESFFFKQHSLHVIIDRDAVMLIVLSGEKTVCHSISTRAFGVQKLKPSI